MINPTEFRACIIRPTLEQMAAQSKLPFDGLSAENLLLGTALQESGLVHLQQIGDSTGLGGHGFFQDEPEDHNDLWANYLAFRMREAGAVNQFVFAGASKLAQLELNLAYAAAICRMHYWRSPAAMPAATDAIALAENYKIYYNSVLGAAKPEQIRMNFDLAIATP